MTLASETVKVSYAGDDSTVSFPITFIYWDDTDIEVILRTDATGAETPWVDGTQYTLSGGDGSTGTLTVDTAPTDYTPATGETLVIRSARPDTQPTDLPLGGSLPSTDIERAVDQAVRLIQQRAEELGRTLKVSKTSPLSDLELPEPDAGKVIKWNGDEDGFENSTYDPDTLQAAAAASAAAAATSETNAANSETAAATSESNAASSAAEAAASAISAVYRIENLAALKAFSTTSNSLIYMRGRLTNGDGGQGHFDWDSSDLSTEVTADTESGIYVAPTTDATGASGAWVRQHVGIIRPEWFGAFPDNATDYGTELQASLTAMPVGSEWRLSAGIYLTSIELVYKPSRTYRGVNPAGDACGIKQADSSNITTGIFVSEGYDTAATVADERVMFKDFLIHGNKANNAGAATAGILATNFYSVIENMFIYQTKGDGIRFDDTHLTSGTAVSNRLISNIIVQPDGDGIHITATGNRFTDGIMSNNEIGNPAEHGIHNLKSAGWRMHNNYIYGAEKYGMLCGGCWNTSISDNIIDGYGYSSTNATYYGIWTSGFDDKPYNISDNVIDIREESVVVGNTYIAINASGAASQTTVQALVSGNNVFFGASATSKFFEAGGSGYGEATLTNNTVKGADVNILKTGGSWTIIHEDNSFDREFITLAGSGTPSVAQGSLFKTSATNIVYSDFTGGFIGQEITVVFDFARGTGSVDFTGTTLKGNGAVDWNFVQYDSMKCVWDGTNWYCNI